MKRVCFIRNEYKRSYSEHFYKPVRARLRCKLAMPPEGMTKFVKGGRAASRSSTQSSNCKVNSCGNLVYAFFSSGEV